MARPKHGRLILYGEGGVKLELEIGAGRLERLLAAALEAGGLPSRLAWEKTGQLGTRELEALWPAELRQPDAAYLRSGKRFRTGMALQVEAPGASLNEYADDIRAFLQGGVPGWRLRHRTAEEDANEPAGPVEAFELIPEAREEPVLVEAPRDQQQAEPMADEPAEVEEPEAAEVEVLPPGTRRKSRPGRRWRLGPGDVFTLVGPVHPQDLPDDGLEIRPEDLPWLNPGDRIVSETRGTCRILRVEENGGQVVVRDAGGRQLMLRSDELLADFAFDDRPDPRLRKKPESNN